MFVLFDKAYSDGAAALGVMAAQNGGDSGGGGLLPGVCFAGLIAENNLERVEYPF